MTLAIEKVTVPLATTPEGSVRVIGTRIPLETVIVAFNAGASAEEIVDSFPSLKLPDVYAVLGFYLQHRDQVDAYVAERQRLGEEIRQRIEKNQESNASFKARLLARKRQLESHSG
jgi:uncharacterized protein (DUF433 family)